jgi:regulator of telomere elongation helicase 1
LCLNLHDTNEKLNSFKLQNLDPSVAFKNITSKGKFNFLFTSGTLAPFESWAEELKMNFEIKLDNKHVINPEK